MNANRVALKRKVKRKSPARANAGLGEIAYKGLIEGIRKGVFRVGSPIRERQVAEWLKISRTPVRDAIRRLQNDGLLTYQIHKGVVVTELDDQSLLELYEMREVLECAAAALSARNATTLEIARLENLIEEAARESGPDALINYLHEIHRHIHAIARNRYLMKALEVLRESLYLAGPAATVLPDRPAQSLKEHRKILRAIKSRNAGAAEQAMRSHIASSLSNRMRLRRETTTREFPYVPYPSDDPLFGASRPHKSRKKDG